MIGRNVSHTRETEGCVDKSGLAACGRDMGESEVTFSCFGEIETSAVRYNRVEASSGNSFCRPSLVMG